MRPRLTYANVTATMALVFALCGGAWAALQLPRNSVRSLNIKNGQVKSRDIGNNQVRSSDIKNGQVKSEDIKDGDVTSADIGAGQVTSANIGNGQVTSANIGNGQVTAANLGAGAVTSTAIGAGQVMGANIGNGQVGAAQLAQPEPFHLVGTTGEPTFGDGGQGDCLWGNFQSGIGTPKPFNPTGFYEDPYGVVHLTGAMRSVNGPGGDAQCGPAGQEGIDDATAFILPVADRPPHELVFVVAGGTGVTTVAVNGLQATDTGNGMIAPGAVLVGGNTGGTNAHLDGIDFRAAGADTGIP